MRILWWTERFSPYVGGIETLGLALIPKLQKLGHEVEVVTSHSAADLPDFDVHSDIPIHRLPFLTALQNGDIHQIIDACRKMTQLKRRFRPDLVHIHFSGPSPLFHWQTQDAFPARTLVSLHSLPSRQNGQQSLLAKTLTQADWVCGVSAHIRKQAQAFSPTIDAKSSVIHNGMIAPRILPKPLPGTPVLLCVGRMVAWKRFAWAIDLFAAIHTHYPTARLVLIGDGAERSALEQKVAELNLQSHVTFTGVLSQSEIINQLNSSTLVLLPSDATENIPYVAIEAGWMARPVIASNVSGIPEIVVDGETGHLVAPTDKTAWLNRLQYLLDNPAHAQQLGRQANAHVKQKFSLSACTERYDRLYRQIEIRS